MKMYLISDNTDTCIGMRLAGVEGEIVKSKEEFSEALERAAGNKDIAVIMITDSLMKLAYNIVDDFKLNRSTPLVIEIPDRHSTSNKRDSIARYVRESIGLNI